MKNTNLNDNRISTEQRFSIIHKNFFINLNSRKISFSKYAEDNVVDRTLGSHWKNGKSKMTVDQIYQAAVYFGITVNDLYYSEKEKKKIAVLSDASYDPIIAQQTLNIRLMNDSFEQPFFLISTSVVLYIVIAFITYFLLKSSPFWIVFLLIGLFLSYTSFKNTFAINKTFIINYLDDIYYKRDSQENKYIGIQIAIRIISIVSMLITISLTRIDRIEPSSVIGIILVFYILFILIYVIVIAFTFGLMDFKNELIIDDYQIQGYTTSLVIFNLSIVLLSASCILIFYDLNQYFLLASISLFISILNLLDFILVSKNYSEYKLMYEEDGNEPRELFPKRIE